MCNVGLQRSFEHDTLRPVRLCHQCGAVATEGDKFCRSCGAAIDNSSNAADPLVGRTIGGSYQVQELVGVGGMGRVYRAEQSTLGRTVAIKVIHPHLLSDEQTVARFYGEARAASRLNHPNSVSIIDFGRTDDGILYLAMEFLKGKDLALVMHEEGPLPFTRICELLVGVLEALDDLDPLASTAASPQSSQWAFADMIAELDAYRFLTWRAALAGRCACGSRISTARAAGPRM